MQADSRVRIGLLTKAEGGLRGAIAPGVFHGIMKFSDGSMHDFRAEIFEPFEPGASRELGIKFLCREDVAPKLIVGDAVQLWPGHLIGEGEILESLL